MTWIKPSFLWLMHRSNWGQKSGQERVLCNAGQASRVGEGAVPGRADLVQCRGVFANCPTSGPSSLRRRRSTCSGTRSRTLRGAGLPYYSIQVRLSRHVIREYVDEWVAEIEDYTPRVRKIYDLVQSGQADKAKRQLPPEPRVPGPVRLPAGDS